MHPILFEFGSLTIYSYGFCIALGALFGFLYMAHQSRKEFNTPFDKSNSLFLLMVAGGVVGGKLFIIFEDPAHFLKNPGELLSGSGFVFYGSLLMCIPLMLWFFRKNNIPVWGMLDIMAVTTCILHFCGRIGCFMAGCCYGKPTEGILGVTFTNPICQAEPLNTSLHPSQLYEAGLILFTLFFLLWLKKNRRFEGQLFLIYLVVYAAGRGVLEIFRGDTSRGFVIDDYLSNSQLISLLIIAGALYFYVKRGNANLVTGKPTSHGK